MKWTIGMPSYNNFTEVFFTVQSLRMYHDLKDAEIIIVDNYGDKILEKWVRNNGKGVVRPMGTSPGMAATDRKTVKITGNMVDMGTRTPL